MSDEQKQDKPLGEAVLEATDFKIPDIQLGKTDAAVVVKDCQFTGIQFDEPTLSVLQTIANGLENLSKIFAGSNIKIDTMMTIKDCKLVTAVEDLPPVTDVSEAEEESS